MIYTNVHCVIPLPEKESEIFDYLFSLEGTIYSRGPRRKNLRVVLDGKAYFVKTHHGVGWKEIIKNLLNLKLPIISAKTEWRALEKLHHLNIPTLEVVACGYRGLSPAHIQSFLITRELENVISLERFCKNWMESPPDGSLKLALIHKIADIARTLHQGGVNHRDFYLCHFLLDQGSLERSKHNPVLYLVDLHRAQIRKKVPFRWKVKDLSGLYFSSLDCGLTRRDYFRFMCAYTQKNLRDTLKTDQKLWFTTERKAKQLYQKIHGHPPYER